MAHARRKFFELHATNKSQLAEQALRYIQLLYEISRGGKIWCFRYMGQLPGFMPWPTIAVDAKLCRRQR